MGVIVVAASVKAARRIRGRFRTVRANWSVFKKAAGEKGRFAHVPLMLNARYRLPEVSLSSLGVAGVKTVDLIMDDSCMPPNFSFMAPDHPSLLRANAHDDMTPLLALAAAWKAKVIVELGTAHGNTTANLCRQCPEATIYTVNAPVEEQSGEVTTFDLTRDEVGRVYKNHGMSDHIVQIYENTLHLDLSKHFASPIVDMAIIDACHDTDYVVNDFLKIEPYMKQGGVVILHDTHPSMYGHLIGSYVACMKLRRKGYNIRHIADTWWGVWVKGE